MPLPEWEKLFALSDKHGFVIASDECYSEIYFQEEAPLGGLEAAKKLGRHDFKNLVMFTSLSKRSNVPGLRSGFVAGDAALLKSFLLYRTYHGGAMSPVVQTASIAAWGDEAHVAENRRLYREKFAQVTPVLSAVMDVKLPDASFYLWAGIPHNCRWMTRSSPKSCMLIQVLPCCPAAIWRVRLKALTLGSTACAWRWWPKPQNAWRLRNVSPSSSSRAPADTDPRPAPQAFLTQAC